MPNTAFEGQTKAKLESIHEDIKEIKDDVKTQNERVRKLENWRSYTIGIISAVILLMGAWLKYA